MNEQIEKDDKLSSSALATLIVDALIDAEIVSKDDTKKSMEITTNEIETRKALGDY